MDFKYTLKNSMAARTLIKPFIDFKRKKDYEEYILSKDSEAIKSYKDKYKGKRCFFVGNGPSLKTSDLEELMCEYKVAFTAIRLAIYMDFSEIYLVGVDFNYSIVRDETEKVSQNENVKDYFFGKKYSSTVLNYNSTLNAYKAAREYADEHGIKILNATRGGKLEVFDRVNFDEAPCGGNT